MPKEYLTISEVATLAKVSKTAVLYAVRDGRIPGAFRIGRTWAIPRAAAKRYAPRSYGNHRRKTTRRVAL
jgi:excisionase family DNA binding protein